MNTIYKNILYFDRINSIGGVETFFYYLAKKYNDYDITILYSEGDKEQIKRLRKFVRVVKFTNRMVRCEKIFFNYNLSIIDKVEAKEYCQIIHADYKAQKQKPNIHPKITKYICVSKLAYDSFQSVSHIKPELCYNPILIDKPRRVLKLVSATRMTKEKGKWRYIKLAKLLDEAEIPYIWLIFTNDKDKIDSPNVIYMSPKLNIIDYIAEANMLVQLSDSESYCYSVVEALSLGKGVIATKCPVFKELDLNKNNSFLLNFDMSNVDVEAIYNKKFNFKYKPPEDTWDKHLEPGKSTYEEEKKLRYLVEATNAYEKYGKVDSELRRVPKQGEKWEVDINRLDVLLGGNDNHKKYVRLVKKIKEENKDVD